MNHNQLAVLLVTALCASIVNGALGYGFSSITMPIALLFLTNRVLNPAMVLIELVVNANTLFVNRGSVAHIWKRVAPILLGILPGVLVGSYFLFRISPEWVKLATYVALLPLILLQAGGIRRPIGRERAVGLPFGAGVGLLYSATTISGPPLAVMLNNQGYVKQEFRAALGLIRTAEALCTAVAYCFLGLYSAQSFRILATIVPSVVVGIPLGSLLIRKMDPEMFRRICMSFDAWIVGFGLSKVALALHLASGPAGYAPLAAAGGIDAVLLARFFIKRGALKAGKPPAFVVAAVLVALPALSARAQVASSTATLTEEQRLDRLEQQVQSLQDRVSAGQRAHSLRLTPPGQLTAQQNEPAGEATAGRSGFALRSDDGDFLIRFEGLLEVDGRFYTGRGDNPASYTPAVDASGQAPADGGFLLRRVRPILAGTLYHDFDFFFQPDFGQNTAAIYDAYFDVKPWSAANLRVGKFKTPLGVERLQTDSYLIFAERGLTADLIPQRDVGAELYGGFWGNAATYQASVTNGTADGAFTPDSPANNSKDVTARVFAQPFKNGGFAPLRGLGVGLAGSYDADNTAVPTYKTAAGQEQFFSYASATAFSGERIHWVPQANYYWGPLGLWGEYAQTSQVARTGSFKTRLTNDAWQVAASWVLTGEDATYTGVVPSKNFDARAGTWGAWELAARLQQLQVDPRTFSLGFASSATSASRATAYTVGLNWYLNKFVKFVADYEETWFEGGNGAVSRPIERVIDVRWQIGF